MFNVLKEKWYIRVGSEQEAIAAQEWAFSKGLGWGGSGKVLREDFKHWDKWGESAAIGSGHHGGGSLGQASSEYWSKHGHKEINLTFKLTVDSVVYPHVESPQQEQIRELEETISLAAAQIKKLKEGV